VLALTKVSGFILGGIFIMSWLIILLSLFDWSK
jgi:hypothetical protein